jgi:y4mF family transcriptional regulator
MDKLNSIAAFIKYNREKLNLTQEMLADKTGVGIHFIRNIEQGKPTLKLEKLDKVLAIFGYRMAPVPNTIDAFQMWHLYKDKAVEIVLKDKRSISGFLVEEIRDERNTIAAWKLVPFPNILQWQLEKGDKWVEIIRHQDIDHIELSKHEQIRKSLTS